MACTGRVSPRQHGRLATYIFDSAQGDQYEYVYGGPAGGAFSTDSLHLASEVVKVSQSCVMQKPPVTGHLV
jgi:hypothetical protein